MAVVKRRGCSSAGGHSYSRFGSVPYAVKVSGSLFSYFGVSVTYRCNGQAGLLFAARYGLSVGPLFAMLFGGVGSLSRISVT